MTLLSLRPPAGKWGVLILLWLVCLLNYADRQAIASVFPLLERNFGFSKVEIGLIGSAFMWVYALSSPIAGLAGDRVGWWGRSGLVAVACLFWSLMTGMTGACSRLWQFLGVRSLIGLGESLYFPSATSLLASWHDRGTRSTALSLHQSAVYLGTIAGGWLGALLAEKIGWRTMFWVFGCTGAAVSLLVMRFLRDAPGPDVVEGKGILGIVGRGKDMESPSGDTVAGGFRTILSDPSVLCLMSGFACANAVASIFLVWGPSFLLERFHLGLVAAGCTAVVWIQLASAFSVPLSGMIADRWINSNPSARVMVQVAGLLIGAVFLILIGTSATLSGVVLSMVGFGLCKGFYDGGIFASLFDRVPDSKRATAAGLMNLCGWGGGALGPVAAGYAAQGAVPDGAGIAGAIAWSASAYLAAAVLLLASRMILAGKSEDTSAA